MKKIFILLFVTTMLFGGCQTREDLISVSGSSTVYPITLEAQSAYQFKMNPNLSMSVESVGTGGGFELFTRGQIQINDASRAINEEEVQQAKDNNIDYSEYRIGTDGITVVINNENDWAQKLTSEQLKKGFEMGSDVKYWSDLDPSFPKEEINFYGPTSASGTYDFFVETILEDADAALRDDMNATENDNEIISNIEKDKYGIGFLGYSYYSNNKDEVQEVEIDGNAPNAENIKSGEYVLSRPLFIYVNNKDMKENQTLNEFVTYYIENAQEFVAAAGYIPLDDKSQQELVKSIVN